MLINEITEGTRCWKGYKKKGMKTMFGKRVPNCVKNESANYIGNCTQDEVVDDIFGDVSEFARQVELHGDEFEIDNLVVEYDPEEDIHHFYIKEDLRAWFGKGKKGGAGGGGWDRYNTKGERIGKCGDSKKGEGKPKCLSKSRAASLRAKGGKKAIGAAVSKKRRQDPNKNRRGKAKNVSNTKGK